MENKTKRGKFGVYMRTNGMFGKGEPELTLYDTKSSAEVYNGELTIRASALNAFVTELIEMARVLGVTGGPDGT